MKLSCLSRPIQAVHALLQAAMQYSEAQIQDLLHLRQLFVHRMGQLARERKALLENMAHCNMTSNHICDKVSEMTKWSELLRANGAEEHSSYMQILTASGRGVKLLFAAFLAPGCAYKLSAK